MLENAKQKISQCFNRARHTYDNHCQVQIKIGDILIDSLQKLLIPATHIIDLGCGTGIITEKLAKTYPHQTFTAIDIAQDLLKIAKNRLPQSVQLHFADFDKTPFANNAFDLVFSNMALHWSTHIEKTLQEIVRISQPSSHLAFSVPIQGTFNETKTLMQQLTGNIYFHDFITNDFLQDLLINYHYKILENKIHHITIEFPNLREALNSLKKIGATYNTKLSKTRESIRNFNKLIQDYDAKLGSQKITLTYVIATIIAKQGTENSCH